MLNELSQEIHQIAVDHGWWNEERTFPEIIALCHSELSEALEEYRAGSMLSYTDAKGKPEGIAVELADTIIRVLDYCAHAKIDIDKAITDKVTYNRGRPYRHGGKVC